MDLVFAIIVVPVFVCILLTVLALFLLRLLAKKLIADEERRRSILPFLSMLVIFAGIYLGYNAIDHGWFAPKLGPWR